MEHTRDIEAARSVLSRLDGVLITAGAGMGVDSGLPDFRGNEGFWNAYPAARRSGLSFADLANPRWFSEDPRRAWGFYGHRLALYRRTRPHRGYDALLRWASKMPLGAFVVTSNVDCAFAAAGYDPLRVEECHGTLGWLQCASDCGAAPWESSSFDPVVDEHDLRLVGDLPRCPSCGGVARPNVLMFGDWGWDWRRASAQRGRREDWLEAARWSKRIAVVELGAGVEIATIRSLGEEVAASLKCPLVRINPRDPEGPDFVVPVRMGALRAIEAITSP